MIYLIFVVLLVVLSGCASRDSDTKPPRFIIKIHDMVSPMYEYYAKDKASIQNLYDSFRRELGDFFDIYTKRILRIGDPNSTTSLNNFIEMIKDPYVHIILRECSQIAKDTVTLLKIKSAFERYASIFSVDNVPAIVLTFSSFGYNVIALPGYLGVSLERYIGDNNIYDRVGIQKYERVSMNKEYLPYDMVKGWILSDIPTDSLRTLLDFMITHGKALYFLDEIFGEGNDHLKIGYTEEQIKWCENHSILIWSFFVEKNLLYSQSYEHIVKYVENAPFSAGMPAGSPGRTGVWVGWQIVRSYCRKHECSPSRLIPLPPSDIFAKSGYKP